MADFFFYAVLVVLGLAAVAVVALLVLWVLGLAFGTVFFPLAWMSDGVRAIIDGRRRRTVAKP